MSRQMLSGRNIMSPHNAMVLLGKYVLCIMYEHPMKVRMSKGSDFTTRVHFDSNCVELGVSVHSILLAAKGQRLCVHKI